VLQAAIAGEGFAFGWRHVTDHLVAQGLLVRRDEWAWTTGAGFYLVWSDNTPLSPQAERVRDWLVALGLSRDARPSAGLDGDRSL